MNLSTIIIILLSVCLIVSLIYNVRFALIILKIEDAIEESLDVIDERYRSVSKVLEIPLFFDSPQIKQVVNDIKITRSTLLLIANKFASIDESEPENSTQEGDDTDDQKS